MALEKETETYAKILPQLIISGTGKYVLISGETVAGIFGAYEDAIRAGYEKYGLVPFLVKQIQMIETERYFAKPFVPCHTY